ncbi:succinylglutamate desuccinylase/aspartoacylase family protein [bacterium]|nr:succinylglutamate desuccinylase/aspartoacylase family protein [bacterium]
MISSAIQFEYDMFTSLKKKFAETHPHYKQINEHGFALTNDSNKLDLLVTGLTHGDEVIGLQIINLLLNDIMLHKKFDLKIGFLLNNLPAFHQGQRYLESDLNRSFMVSEIKTSEQKIASDIQNIIENLQIKLILDLHQTSEPTKDCFAVIPEVPELIQLAYQFSPKSPIVSFSSEGFSSEGKTLLEYAQNTGVKSLTFEIGQKGLNADLANQFKTIIFNALSSLDEILQKSVKNLGYLMINQMIPNINGYALKPGLKSLDPVVKDQILADNQITADVFKSPIDGYIIFPRYHNIRAVESNIGVLATEKRLN